MEKNPLDNDEISYLLYSIDLWAFHGFPIYLFIFQWSRLRWLIVEKWHVGWGGHLLYDCGGGEGMEGGIQTP
jgi:hypothetical protein